MVFYIVVLLFAVCSIIFKIWLSNPANKGKYGEFKIERKLSSLSSEYTIFNDVLLPTINGTTQIDHLIASPYGIFIIETKNY